MSATWPTDTADLSTPPWRLAVVKYQEPDVRRSVWQIVNTLVPYFVLWYLMYRSLAVSYWLTLALSILASGFLVRAFIIFHDCGHGSFFESRKANDVVGFITGVLTFTPYFFWRHGHAGHHATAGDLDRRGVGDIWTLTAQEYLQLSPWRRLGYRLFRHPLVLFGIGPAFVFFINQRLTHGVPDKRDRYSVYWTNLALLAIVAVMAAAIGIKAYLLIQIPVVLMAGAAGVWMFYVQHQFEGMVWERHDDWDFAAAALKSCSFYELPGVLRWFTGNIGFHHIHHLAPRIPNYNLEKCYRENPMLREIKPLTLRSSLKSLGLRVWDEEQRRLVGFGSIGTVLPPSCT